MRAEFRNESLVVIPETSEEVEKFNKLFPEKFMKTSRYMNVRQFVDMFGNPEPNRPYLLLNGFDGSEERLLKPRRKKNEDATPVLAG